MTEGFFHCSVKSVGRGNGRSVVAAAAYRAGLRLVDERTGEIADYRARSGVDETFVLARADAMARAHDIGRLWNDAERAEPRANGRIATEIVLALPHELDAAARKQLLKDYVAPIIEKYGVAVQVSIHAPDKEGDHRNWHAHVLVTHRQYGRDGFGEVSNPREIVKKRGREMIYGIAANPADIVALRKAWEQHVNQAYERAGLDIRVDHRSHKDRGFEQEPTKHLGPTASAMERRGEPSDRGDINREIEARNAALAERAQLEIEAVKVAADLAAEKMLVEMERAPDSSADRYGVTPENLEIRSGPETGADRREQVKSEARSAGWDITDVPMDYDDRQARHDDQAAWEAWKEEQEGPAYYDRDADDAAWNDAVNAAGIAASERKHRLFAPRADSQTRAEAARELLQRREPTAAPTPPANQNARTDGPQNEPQGPSAPRSGDVEKNSSKRSDTTPSERALDRAASTAEKVAEKPLAKAFEIFGRTVTALFAGLTKFFDLFPAAPPDPAQQKRNRLAAAEQAATDEIKARQEATDELRRGQRYAVTDERLARLEAIARAPAPPMPEQQQQEQDRSRGYERER